jgi:hypothetical protein
MRAPVIIPRSPTSTTRDRSKRALSLLIWGQAASGRAVLPFEHLDRHRAAIGGTQQAVDDLHFALLAVAQIACASSPHLPSSQDEETS